MATIEVDARAVDKLAADIGKAKRQMLVRLAERGQQLLRGEVPYVTGKLKAGVVDPKYDFENLTAAIVVSAARDERPERTTKLIGADGKEKRSVTLRPQQAFN